jgi:hypothetical protein
MSGEVVVNRSMSLDGFIAGPGAGPDHTARFSCPAAGASRGCGAR